MDSSSHTNPTGENIELVHRVPDSPGSRSSYGEFYWDTNGENTYHASDSFDSSEVALESDASARLGRTQHDLNKYRQRIDANVEQQREYSDMMAGLQHKVQQYRRHIAQLEGKLLSRGSDEEPSSFTMLDSSVFPDAKYKEETMWGQNSAADYQVLARLDDERRRVEEYRMQLEQERVQNDQLQREVERIRQQYEASMNDNERVHRNRERNLAQYLSDEQKKMMDLWTELQRVRKQFTDLKEQTVHDLENQRNEFIKVVRSVGGVTKQLHLTGLEGHSSPVQPLVVDLSSLGGNRGNSTTINHDAVLIEAIKRCKESHGEGSAATTQFINELKLGTGNDSDINAELMNKYEESIERNIQLESRGDEAQRKMAGLEAELRRTKERLNDNQSALRKLHELAQDLNRSPDSHKRTRSLSPGSSPLPPSEALRSVRNMLRNRDNDIQQLERKLKITENQMNDFMSKLETAEETRRRVEKQLADAKRDISHHAKTVEDVERQSRRLDDKLRGAEAEKAAAEKARKYLEEELSKLQLQFHNTSVDGERKAREEAQELNHTLEEEYKNRITELTRRLENVQRENSKLKSESNMVKNKYRDIENEYTTIIRKVDERDATVKHLEELKRQMVKELEEQRTRFDTLSTEHERVSNECDNNNKTTLITEHTLKEVKQQRDDYSKQRDELSRQLFDIKHQLENEKVTSDEMDKHKQRAMEEIEKLKQQITELERELIMVRHHNDELDTQIKSSQAKMAGVENELLSSHKEIEKLSELNTLLQREKQQVLNQKHKTEADMDAVKEHIRKLEQEAERLRNESFVHEKKHETASDALQQQTNQTHLLSKQLAEAKEDIERLNNKIKQLEQQLAERMRGSMRGKGFDGDTGERIVIGPNGPIAPGGATGPGAGDVTGPGGYSGATGPVGGFTGSDGFVGPSSIYYDSQITEIRIKEINDKWKHDFERLENEKDDVERRLRELEDELSESKRSVDRQDTDVSELRRKHQAEIDRLKTEMAHLYDKHQNDLDDEKEQYNKNMDSIKLVEEELRDKLSVAEKRLAELLNKENDLERENKEWDDKYQALGNQLHKLKEDLEEARNQAEKEIQKWKTDSYSARCELKALEAAHAAIKTQLTAGTDRSETLNKTVNDQSTKIRELNSQLRHLEEDVTDTKSSLLSRDTDLESALGRVRSLEEQLASAQLEYSKTRAEFDTLQREHDVIKGTNTSNTSEMERCSKKLLLSEVTIKECRSTMEHLRTEKERVQNAYRDKAKQADHLSQLSQSFDVKMNKMRQDLKDNSDKLVSTDAERNALRSEVSKLQQELQFGRDQMVRKTDEFQSSLEELANSHRVAEDARLNALQQLESRKYEIADLESRLANAEQRLAALQQEYIKADSERDILIDVLRRFQLAANRATNLNRFTQGADGTKSDSQDIILEHHDDGDRRFHSVPFPSAVDFGSGTAGDAMGGIRPGGIGSEGTTINIGDSLDINHLENALQTLINRIDKLERERIEYRETVNRLKQRTSDTHTTINRHETRYKSIEENLVDVEEEKHALEVKFASAKQLLRSQEEALKQRDDERRNIKSKMVAAELQARGKEAQLRHLTEQMKNLRTDLENAHADVRQLRDREEQWDASRFQLESKIRDNTGEIQRLKLLMANFDSEKQSLTEKVKQLSGQLQLSELKCSDMKEDTERLKRELTKAEAAETEMRHTTEQFTKTTNEFTILRDQLNNTQNEVSNANNRKQQVENELMGLRMELRELKQRVHDVNNRAADLQRQLQDAHSDKHRLEERMLTMEKTITAQKSTENELRQHTESVKNEHKSSHKELDEHRYRLTQIENDKRSLQTQLDTMRRERVGLMKKIELFEVEKRRTDGAIRETALQREAIEKSLNAMEKENKELYKNCAQLQQQIAQLEMENGNRIMELTNKQREEQEKHLLRMRNEKQQVERLIENRERIQHNRIKQLENQLSMLREQLDNERRRRRDYVDRSLAGDMGKLGGGLFGMRTPHNAAFHGGIHSAGVLPRLGNNVSTYKQTTFASNPLTPPLGTSTPTNTRMGGERITLDDAPLSPVEQDVSQSYMSSSSHQQSTIDDDLDTLEPSKEIEEVRR